GRALTGDYGGLALGSAIAYESESNGQFKTINRLTQLYHLERVFNTTLLMYKLLTIIPSKIEEILEVQAVNLWMVEDEDVVLMSQAGTDPSAGVGDTQGEKEGVAGEVGESGRAMLLAGARRARGGARKA